MKWLMKKAFTEKVQIYQEQIIGIEKMEKQKREKFENSIQKRKRKDEGDLNSDLKTSHITTSSFKRTKSQVHMFSRRKKSQQHREKSKSVC